MPEPLEQSLCLCHVNTLMVCVDWEHRTFHCCLAQLDMQCFKLLLNGLHFCTNINLFEYNSAFHAAPGHCRVPGQATALSSHSVIQLSHLQQLHGLPLQNLLIHSQDKITVGKIIFQLRILHTTLPRTVSQNQGNLRHILYLLNLSLSLPPSFLPFSFLPLFPIWYFHKDGILHLPVWISLFQPLTSSLTFLCLHR